MTTATLPGSTRGFADTARNTALVAGILYLVTFASSIPAVFLIDPVLTDVGYIVGGGADTRITWGALLDIINALACIGTAVVLFPLLKRQSERLALGFVTARMFEAAIIVIGVVSLLAVVTLRQEALGMDEATLAVTGRALVAVRDWTFLLGPGLIPALNALLLGTLMYRSGLVPRVIPVLGLIGAPLLISSTLGTIFGINAPVSAWTAIAVAPIFFWELSIGLWMAIKGFKPSAALFRRAELDWESA